MQNKTPEHWEEKTIKQLSNLICDGDWIESKNQSQIGIRLIQTGNIGNGYYKDKPVNARYISNEIFEKLNCTEIFSGDCLVSRLPEPLGRACLIPNRNERMITAVDCSIIRFNTQIIIPEFFIYYSMSNNYNQKVVNLSTGSTRQRISRKNLETITVPIPNLEEQQRIVKILDEAFENIDKAKKNAEKNLSNAKEIYNTTREQFFEKIIANNKPVYLGDIIETLTDYHANGSYKLLKEHVTLLDKKDYAWMIRSTDFENEFQNAFKYINQSAYNFLEKTKVYGGEIIMSKIGNAGKIYLMPAVNQPVSLAMNLFLIRIKNEYATSSYVYNFLLTKIGQTQIFERCKGAATQTITKDAVRNIQVYLPDSIKEQQKIVAQLDELQNQIKKLEKIYSQKIKDLDELKQSILQKAFSGDLV